MSHTLSKVNVGNNALVVVKIVDYVQGGEAFTLAELGLNGGLVNVLFISNTNPTITPKVVGGKVLLWNQGDLMPDMISTVGLNYVFAAIVQGT